jgi:hypothetical protein
VGAEFHKDQAPTVAPVVLSDDLAALPLLDLRIPPQAAPLSVLKAVVCPDSVPSLVLTLTRQAGETMGGVDAALADYAARLVACLGRIHVGHGGSALIIDYSQSVESPGSVSLRLVPQTPDASSGDRLKALAGLFNRVLESSYT